MSAFSSAMTPEDFAVALGERRKLWRRNAGACHPSIRRRYVNALTRRHVTRFKRIRRLSRLPAIAFPADLADSWDASDNPGSVKIIVLPEHGRVDEATVDGRTEPARKGLRRRFRELVSDPDPLRIELITSRPNRRSSLPDIGSARSGPIKEVRALYLEALEAAIVPGLTEDQIRTLEEAGAIVMDNKLISIDEPVEVGGTALATAEMAAQAWHRGAIGLDAARAKNLTGRGTTIGILDTGIDADHPEFAGKTIRYQSFGPSGTLRRLKRPKDYGNHGTHVAAISSGVTCGIAPEASLAVAAVLNQKDQTGKLVGYHAQILAGLNWLTESAMDERNPESVDIINASLGGANQAGYHSLMAGYMLEGTLVVAAIGNNGRKGVGHHCAPGMFDCVLAVGAADQSGSVAHFSDWGPACHGTQALTNYKPDILAPGVGIISAIPGKRYIAMNGTSMACPIVSGVAALLIEQNQALRRNPTELTNRLLSLVSGHRSDAPDIERCGKGSVDLRSI